MKLISIKTQRIAAQLLEEGVVVVSNRFIAKQIEQQGIAIPPSHRHEFHGKAVVYLKDPDFPKAFKEIYSPQIYAVNEYQWI